MNKERFFRVPRVGGSQGGGLVPRAHALVGVVLCNLSLYNITSCMYPCLQQICVFLALASSRMRESENRACRSAFGPPA